LKKLFYNNTQRFLTKMILYRDIAKKDLYG